MDMGGYHNATSNDQYLKRRMDFISTDELDFSNQKRHKNLGTGDDHILSEKDARFCSGWLNDFMVEICPYGPGEDHFAALGTLIGAPNSSVRKWWSQILLERVTPNQNVNASNEKDCVMVQYQPKTKSSAFRKNREVPKQKPGSSTFNSANDVEPPPETDGKDAEDAKCNATTNTQLLRWTKAKPLQCTRSCGKSFDKKKNWKRHEETNYPPNAFICLVGYVKHDGSCAFCQTIHPDANHVREHQENGHKPNTPLTKDGICGKIFHRKDHLVTHLKSKIHSVVPIVADGDFKTWSFPLTSFPRDCGFCDERFETWTARIDHISDHFKKHEKSMADWSSKTGSVVTTNSPRFTDAQPQVVDQTRNLGNEFDRLSDTSTTNKVPREQFTTLGGIGAAQYITSRALNSTRHANQSQSEGNSPAEKIISSRSSTPQQRKRLTRTRGSGTSSSAASIGDTGLEVFDISSRSDIVPVERVGTSSSLSDDHLDWLVSFARESTFLMLTLSIRIVTSS
jgi:hypothetical protein